MVSIITIGVILYSASFFIIALYALKDYLEERDESRKAKKKYIFYAFASWSISFIFDLTGSLMVSLGETSLAENLFMLFDAFNVIGVFFLFIFMTKFMTPMKRYIPWVSLHLALTLALIFLFPLSLTVDGTMYVKHYDGYAGITALAIVFFWFLYWGLIAYEFWKSSKLMTKRIAIIRSKMMSAGGVFAVLAYLFVMIAANRPHIAIILASQFFAMAAGIVFYVGFVAPKFLRKMFEK